MTALNLPDGRALWLEQAPECLVLEPAFDGARIAVELKSWTQSPPQDQISAQVTATMLVGRSHNPNEMRALAALRSDGLVFTQASPTRLALSGRVSAQALREVEEQREGGPLRWTDGVGRGHGSSGPRRWQGRRAGLQGADQIAGRSEQDDDVVFRARGSPDPAVPGRCRGHCSVLRGRCCAEAAVGCGGDDGLGHG
jgi:hypothetical protein